jgi:enoyl-CoA hydratase/carnithine racemase
MKTAGNTVSETVPGSQMPLLVESDGVVVLAMMDREAVRNALDVEMLFGLARLLSNPPGRAVVLTGAGAASFCAGMDLRVLPSAPPGDAAAAVHALDAAVDAEDRVTIVAALNGPATAVASSWRCGAIWWSPPTTLTCICLR